jgi:hypothetical protein
MASVARYARTFPPKYTSSGYRLVVIGLDVRASLLRGLDNAKRIDVFLELGKNSVGACQWLQRRRVTASSRVYIEASTVFESKPDRFASRHP